MPEKDEKGAPAHGLSDHVYGQDINHVHPAGMVFDHDHDHFEEDGPLEENALWIQDHISLVSVGIDIGSSGTQVLFSRINMRRPGEDLSSRYFVVSREALYQSPVSLTPYQSEERIDEAALGAIIDEAYNAAKLGPEDIDTGAVILTGEALRRENAEAIAGILSERGGDFVCATAGHHMEAMLAAYGSGAARVSNDEGNRILNIDIGGGTTKLAVVEAGRVIRTAALHVGGRLHVVDGDQRLTRLDPAGRHLAAQAGFAWALGDRAPLEAMDTVAAWMADAVIAAVRDQVPPPAIEKLYLTEPLGDLGRIDGIMFSGGVAEYVYRREGRDFGDMGRRLGYALRRRIEGGALPWPLLPARECIRATALGASEYSVQLSGNTIYVSNPRSLLPRRNLQVLQPTLDLPEEIEVEQVAQTIRAHFAAFDLTEGESEIALALRWRGAPSYDRIAAFAKGIVLGLAQTVGTKKPLYLVLDGDLAQTLGGILREEMGIDNDLLVIDGIILWDFDYIDLGRVRLPSHTVPVTVKSLVFSEDPRTPTGAHHLEAHDGGHSHGHPHHGHDHHHHHHHD
jgi:ethanolamine utilization protein EutA